MLHGWVFFLVWPMGRMNLLLPAAYDVNVLIDGGKRKQGILCKVILTV